MDIVRIDDDQARGEFVESVVQIHSNTPIKKLQKAACIYWRARVDLNHRPLASEANTLSS